MPESVDQGWFWELNISCDSYFEELFSYYLFEENASGIEELNRSSTAVEFKVFFPSTIAQPNDLIERIRIQIEASENEIVVLHSAKKPIENWQSNWKKHFKTIEVGASFIVRPPWEKAQGDRKEIVIQPGFGFGTGYHESTFLALSLLEKTAKQQQFTSVIDIGTGSGILTIGAFLLGADEVTAIDIEEESMEEVIQNLELSGLKDRNCRVIQATPDKLSEPAELVLANIEDHILLKMVQDFERLAKNVLILSGILSERKQSVINALVTDFAVEEELQKAEWTGLVLKRK